MPGLRCAISRSLAALFAIHFLCAIAVSLMPGGKAKLSRTRLLDHNIDSSFFALDEECCFYTFAQSMVQFPIDENPISRFCHIPTPNRTALERCETTNCQCGHRSCGGVAFVYGQGRWACVPFPGLISFYVHANLFFGLPTTLHR
jgi:hypothetical protein